MKSFALYTGARLLLFAAAFGLIWLVFGNWLTWGAVSVLYTALIAMVVSSLVALFALGSLRNSLAADVSARADRAKAAFDAMRAAEDEAPQPPASESSAGGSPPPGEDSPDRPA